MAGVVRRAPAGRPQQQAKPVTGGYRGDEGLRRMRQEEEQQAARREAAKLNSDMPFRFFCPVGETREVVVVDYELREVFFRYEHNLKNRRSGKWDIFCACINEDAACPVCQEAERPSYYAMYLTVIDLTPYDSEKHGHIPWSKKLLVVKTAQQKKITRLEERSGPLRGMILAMTRDSDKDANIGNDIVYVEHMTEEDLATYEMDYEYTDAQGKKKVKNIIGHEPFDYDKLFPAPTEQQLRAIVGGRPVAGSREEEQQAGIRRSSSRAQSDDWQGDEAPPARTTRPAARRAAPRDEVAEDADVPADDDVAVDDAPPPRRAAPGRSAAPATRRPARQVEEPEEVVEDEPPQRQSRAAPPPRQSAAPSRSARPARPDPEEVPEDEAPPARPSAASIAERRRALRRG